ncbi:MAG: hypothetical protein GY940_39140 [bacterium]|nr:hypothetical protein [bacterium]
MSLIIGALILAGLVWFVLIVVGKSVFEDVIGGFFRKIRRRTKDENDKDHYVY